MNHIANYTINEVPDNFLNRATEAIHNTSPLIFNASVDSELNNHAPEEHTLNEFKQIFTDEDGHQRIIGNIIDGRLAVITVGQTAIKLSMRSEA
jgi:hypothetical protein